MEQTGLKWNPAPVDGGATLLDYRVMYAVEGGVYEVLAQGVTGNSFIAENLATGVTYSFKIQARNLQGFSDFTVPVTTITAQVPTKPEAPIAYFEPDQIVIQWEAPEDNGDVIISFAILIQHADGVTYSEDLVNCDGSDSAIMAA